ncbi:MAG: PRC-barrel domain-containing protein [Solirubrobacterales bacterium]
MSEPETAPPPSLDEARALVGHKVDDAGGNSVGEVHGFFVDAGSGAPTWLIAKQGRFSSTLVAIPLGDCAPGGGRVWVAHPRDVVRRAPVVDPARPLLREHEITICAHYGIGEKVGRAVQVVGREEGSATSRPAL